jgi:hypothetical protein
MEEVQMYFNDVKRKCPYDYVSILIFWNCLASTEFNCILLFVVFIVLISIVVLT